MGEVIKFPVPEKEKDTSEGLKEEKKSGDVIDFDEAAKELGAGDMKRRRKMSEIIERQKREQRIADGSAWNPDDPDRPGFHE